MPALVMQPPRGDRVGRDVGPWFGGSARSPTHVHAVSSASWPSLMMFRWPPQDRHLDILVEHQFRQRLGGQRPACG
ncbi:hypothetical protein ACFVKB_37445 [Rhodococcus sp. NPDC127530]|uniref:hypothetical protein n=1 Tax=unclassified Rhodococcus (in: high G+C Gram-positive bacteria) TaxID=192944 RepID=UPI003634EF51